MYQEVKIARDNPFARRTPEQQKTLEAARAARVSAEAEAAAAAAKRLSNSWITERVSYRNQITAGSAYGGKVTQEHFAEVMAGYIAAYNESAGVSNPLAMSVQSDGLTVSEENGDIAGKIRFFPCGDSPLFATFTTPSETGRVEIREHRSVTGLALLEAVSRRLLDRILFPDLKPVRYHGES